MEKSNDGKTTDGNYPGLDANTVVYANSSRRLSSIPQGVSGQVLTAGVGGLVGWQNDGGGTVTSVGCTVPSILTVSGVPFTGSGVINIGTALSPNGNGAIVLSNSASLVTPNIGDANGTSLALSGNVDVAVFGPSSGPNLPVNFTVRNGPTSKLDLCIAGAAGNFSTSALQGDAILRSVNGRLILQNGSSGGGMILELGGGVRFPNANTSTLAYFNSNRDLVSVAQGSVGQVLTAGSGGSVSWTSDGGGTVTSVGCSVPSILTVSGVPITGSGSINIGTALSPNGNGAIVLSNSASLVTPNIGDATGTSLALSGNVDVAVFGNSSNPTVPTNIRVRNESTLFGDFAIAGTAGNYSSDSFQSDIIIRSGLATNGVIIQCGGAESAIDIRLRDGIFNRTKIKSLTTPNRLSITESVLAPIEVSSNVECLNLNAGLLKGLTWADTGVSGIGSGTPRPGVFSTLRCTGISASRVVLTDASSNLSTAAAGSEGQVLKITSGIIGFNDYSYMAYERLGTASFTPGWATITLWNFLASSGTLLTFAGGIFTNNLGRTVYVNVSFSGTFQTTQASAAVRITDNLGYAWGISNCVGVFPHCNAIIRLPAGNSFKVELNTSTTSTINSIRLQLIIN